MASPSTARTILRKSSTVLAAQAVLAVVTVLLGWFTRWELAVVGLCLMLLVVTVAVVGPWGSAAQPAAASPAKGLGDLEQRVDALGARLVASTERTRVEVLDALAEGGRQDRTP